MGAGWAGLGMGLGWGLRKGGGVWVRIWVLRRCEGRVYKSRGVWRGSGWVVFKNIEAGVRVDRAGYFCRGGSIKGEGKWVILVSIRVRLRSLVWGC